MTQKRF